MTERTADTRIRDFTRLLERELADPDHEPFCGPFPLTMRVTYFDGPGVQLLDANGNAIVPDLIRDEEQAVWLLRTLNGLGDRLA